ncbi:MAG: GNAT family N-acetyltransferase [Planctomycetes bacterium]|nr:GNAT family N-acetyltransferase [Planctomycetota bacterium]
MQQKVATTYLEMTDPKALKPARANDLPFQLMQAKLPSPELNRFLYTAVGADWVWYSRLPWDTTRWLTYLDRAELETWVAYVSGTPAGYFELERQPSDQVEIVHFGLLPSFVGQGLGGPLLFATIQRAWDMGAKRVWVHTCDLDHPHALRNYQARGFQIYRTEEEIETLPDHPLESWRGDRNT